MKRIIKLIWGLAGSVFILLLLANLLVHFTPAGVTYLPLGWWHFLVRTLPEITPNWNLIGMALVCSVIGLGLSHWLLRSLWPHTRSATTQNQAPRPWRWQNTLALYAMLWLLFAIACGTSGILQIGTWMRKDQRPWYEERLWPVWALQQFHLSITQVLGDNGDKLGNSYRQFLIEPNPCNSSQPLSEVMNTIFYGDASGKVTAFVIIPRQEQLVKKGVFAVATTDPVDLSFKQWPELERTIAELDARYPEKR